MHFPPNVISWKRKSLCVQYDNNSIKITNITNQNIDIFQVNSEINKYCNCDNTFRRKV